MSETPKFPWSTLALVLVYWVGTGGFLILSCRFPWVLAFPVILFAASLPIPHLRRKRSLKRKGWFVGSKCQDHPFYQETEGGIVRSFEIPQEIVEYGRYRLLIPSIPEWRTTAPDWAQERRDEIFTRILSTWWNENASYPDDWPAR